MTAILTQSRHAKFVTAFHNKVSRSPKEVLLKYLTPQEVDSSEEFSLDVFTGTAPATTVEKEVVFSCLYVKNSDEFDESIVGFNKLNDGKIYLSPKQILNHFPIFKLDARYCIFVLDGVEYLCTKVSAKEELYGTCVAVEFTIKDKLRG